MLELRTKERVVDYGKLWMRKQKVEVHLLVICLNLYYDSP